MNQLERIQAIYRLLKEETLSKNDIIERLQTDISLRQIERDLKDLETFYLRDDETLIKNTHFRRHTYSIDKDKPKETETKLSIEDYAVLEMLQISGNTTLCDSNEKALDLHNTHQKSIKDYFQGMPPDNIIEKSFFYELTKNKDFITNLKTVYRAIYEQKEIRISKITMDVTSENAKNLEEKNEILKPLKILYHRGDFCLCAFKNKKFLTYSLIQLKNVNILKKGFDRKEWLEKGNIEMKTRFGITKRSKVSNKTEKIKLQFSESTGFFVSNFFWHNTQNITQLPNKDYLVEFESEINRELVGWIFQWMNNVKVIEPKELKDLHNKILKDILEVHTKDKDKVESKNFFND